MLALLAKKIFAVCCRFRSRDSAAVVHRAR